jgi:hypothetical protein
MDGIFVYSGMVYIDLPNIIHGFGFNGIQTDKTRETYGFDDLLDDKRTTDDQ